MDAQTLPYLIWSKLLGSCQGGEMNPNLVASKLLLLYLSTLCVVIALYGLTTRLQILTTAVTCLAASCLVCMIPNSL